MCMPIAQNSMCIFLFCTSSKDRYLYIHSSRLCSRWGFVFVCSTCHQGHDHGKSMGERRASKTSCRLSGTWLDLQEEGQSPADWCRLCPFLSRWRWRWVSLVSAHTATGGPWNLERHPPPLPAVWAQAPMCRCTRDVWKVSWWTGGRV